MIIVNLLVFALDRQPLSTITEKCPFFSPVVASPNILGKLVQFWVGWNVLPKELDVEVVDSHFPKSSTCFNLLKLPGHYKEYSVFERDVLAAIWSVDTGFGMV